MSLIVELLTSLSHLGMGSNLSVHEQKRYRVLNASFLISIAVSFFLVLFYFFSGAHTYVFQSLFTFFIISGGFALRVTGYRLISIAGTLFYANISIFLAEYSFPIGSDLHILYLIPLATLFLIYQQKEWRYIGFFTFMPIVLHTCVLLTDYVAPIWLAPLISIEKGVSVYVMSYLAFFVTILTLTAFVLIYANENFQTEQLLAEQITTIRDQEQKLSSILNAIPDPIWLVDVNYNVFVGNEAMAKQYENRTGKQISSGMAMTTSAYTPEEQRMWQAKYSSALAGNYESFEYTSVYPDGRRWFAITVAPVVIGNRITGAVGILRDITAIKRTQQGIIRSEANLKAVISSLDDIIFQINKDHQIENVWTSDHYAFTNVGELIGKSVAPFFYQASSQVITAIDVVLSTHKSQSIEFYIEQMQRWYRAKIMYVMISGKETATVLLADITSRKQYEQQILDLNGKLTQLNENLEDRVAERTNKLKLLTSELQKEVQTRKLAEERLSGALEREHTFSSMKTRLVTLMSHQFRTPLTYIQSGVDLIEHATRTGKSLTAEQTARQLESVHIGTAQIVSLLDSISHLMDVQTTILQEDPVTCLVADIIHSVVQELQWSKDLQSVNITERIHLHIAESLSVTVSQTALKTALYELIKNALLYSFVDSTVDILVEQNHTEQRDIEPHSKQDEENDEEQDHRDTMADSTHVPSNSIVSIMVKNQGKSIASKELTSIFEYFYRSGEHERIGSSRALGIGLGLVQFCADAMDGSVDVTSSPETTTTVFTFTFPQHTVPYV